MSIRRALRDHRRGIERDLQPARAWRVVVRVTRPDEPCELRVLAMFVTGLVDGSLDEDGDALIVSFTTWASQQDSAERFGCRHFERRGFDTCGAHAYPIVTVR